MRIVRAFLGTERQLQFGGVDFPEPPVVENMTFDAVQNDCNLVPLDYKKGDVFFTDSSTPLHTKRALDLVWTIGGTKGQVDAAIKILVPYLQDLTKLADSKDFHSATRVLWSDNPKYKPNTVARLVMVRIFRNEDFECREHPEMLSGEPRGQYHCPFCANMQVAGTMHMKDEEPVRSQGER